MHDIEKLYLDLYTTSVKMMTRILRDWAAAEDVVQEAFCRAWKFYPSYNPERGDLRKWFNGILFNSLRDYQNSSRSVSYNNAPDLSSEDVLEDFSDEEKKLKREILQDKINKTNNPIHRDVLDLFFVYGYTSREVAQIVEKMTTTNVTTIVMRFKEKLK